MRGAESCTQRLWQRPRHSADPENEEIELISAVKYRRERRFGDVCRPRDRPGPDAVRQAQDRPTMRHIGKAEAPGPMGLDQCLARRWGSSTLSTGPRALR